MIPSCVLMACRREAYSQSSFVLLVPFGPIIVFVYFEEIFGSVQGTNGGVTFLGIAASAAGGLFVGLVFYFGSLISPGIRRSDMLFAAAKQQWILIPLGELTQHI